MVTTLPQRLDSTLAHDIARAMIDGFDRHYRLFRAESARAKHRFETQDWHGQQRAQRERIEFYDLRVKECVTRLERELLMALLQHPEDVPRETAQRALVTTFSQQALATARDALLAAFEHYGAPDWARRVTEEAPAAFAPLITQLAIAPLPVRDDHVAEYCAGITTSLISRPRRGTVAATASASSPPAAASTR